jgi:hypothetical protein
MIHPPGLKTRAHNRDDEPRAILLDNAPTPESDNARPGHCSGEPKKYRSALEITPARPRRVILQPANRPSLDWLGAHYPKLLSSQRRDHTVAPSWPSYLNRLPYELLSNIISHAMPKSPHGGPNWDDYRKYKTALRTLSDVFPSMKQVLITMAVKQCVAEATRVEEQFRKLRRGDFVMPTGRASVHLEDSLVSIIMTDCDLQFLIGETLLLGAAEADLIDEQEDDGGVLYRVLVECHFGKRGTWDWMYVHMDLAIMCSAGDYSPSVW